MCKLLILLVILFNFIQDGILSQNPSAEKLAQDKRNYYARSRFLRHGQIKSITPFMEGGKKQEITSYPYIVSLREDDSGRHFCGGTIIDTKHVVTAAQCFCGKHLKESTKFVVITGTDRIDEYDYDASSTYTVAETHCHPEFMEVTSTHDIALVVTNKPFRFSDKVYQIAMVSGAYSNIPAIEPELTVTLIGWSADDSAIKDDNSYLQCIITKTISAADCKRILQEGGLQPDIGQHIYDICTFNPYQKTCMGNNVGTPVVLEGKLLGLTSWSQCKRDVPDVHTSIKHHYSWLFRMMKQTG